MNFKKFFSSFFTYTPPYTQKHTFNLAEDANNKYYPDSNIDNTITEKVFNSVDVNIDFLKSKFNILINSDIVFRDFILNIKGKQYKALLVFIDGLVNTQIVNQFILKPLMMRNKNNLFDGSHNRVISEAVTNNVTVRKVKKFNLPNYISSCLVPQNDIKEVSSFEEILAGINSRELCFIYRYFRYCF
mgnify:FL=1